RRLASRRVRARPARRRRARSYVDGPSYSDPFRGHSWRVALALSRDAFRRVQGPCLREGAVRECGAKSRPYKDVGRPGTVSTLCGTPTVLLWTKSWMSALDAVRPLVPPRTAAQRTPSLALRDTTLYA